MSHIGKKTESILEKGKRSRETWSPRLGGAPMRHYVWWREQTGKYRSQENFCHFWRVVLIWAPMLRLRQLTLDRNAVIWMRRNVGATGLVMAICVLYLTVLFVYGSIALAREFWDKIGAWAILLGPLAFVALIVTLVGCIVAFGYVCMGLRRLHRKFKSSSDCMDKPASPIYPRRAIQPLVKRRQLPQRARVANSKLKRFCRSTGEYLVLIAQVVRVKKWKICPLVQIPEPISLEK